MFVLAVLCLVSLTAQSVTGEKDQTNHSVTVEVVLEVEVKNYNGNGDDIQGPIVIGLFGETVPVAALNFKTLCEGFKRPNVSELLVVR